MEILFVAVLTLIAACLGTVTGFGTATIMVPVLLLLYPLPETLLLTGIIHFFGNLWKVLLFWQGFNWRLVLGFGLPGLAFAWIGASFVFSVSEEVLTSLLGIVLLSFSLFLFVNDRFQLPISSAVAALGGSISGFLSGVFGVGGAVHAAFLTTFNLPKGVYLATAGCIGLIIDSGRIVRYLIEGTTITSIPLSFVPVFIGTSFIGAMIARRIVLHIPQAKFRQVTLGFLFLLALPYIFFG